MDCNAIDIARSEQEVRAGLRKGFHDQIMEDTVKDYLQSSGFRRKMLLRESLIDGKGMINYGQSNLEDAKQRAIIMIEALEGIATIYEKDRDSISDLRREIILNW